MPNTRDPRPDPQPDAQPHPQPGAQQDPGSYIVLNGQRVELVRHPTDFSVIAPLNAMAEGVADEGLYENAALAPLTANQTRVQIENPEARDEVMAEVRQTNVAHHIYQVQDTDEEIVIDNRILLTLRYEDPAALESIIQEYQLQPEGRLGDAHVLRVTSASGMNPLKVANLIAQRDDVLSCQPQVLIPMQLHEGSLTDRYRLFRQQWYLSSELSVSRDVHPNAGIQAPEAWQITPGDPSIVIAVIDDGFDLDHPAFRGKAIHPAARDFAVAPFDNDPRTGPDDYHGTCVASVAVGSAAGDAMLGVAPGCTFLPIRIGFGPLAPPIDMLEVFRYVSRFADVVNCSFGTPPSSIDRFPAAFRQEITALTRTGGRRGKGLVMVFSAANDDAPTFLSAAENVNGVSFTQGRQLVRIPAGRPVFSGYPMTPGVIVVGAMSSLRRKSGYSCWGPHITVTAPSNNMHYITSFVPVGTPGRDRFVANYRGLGQIAATNRPDHGAPFSPLADDPATPDLRENYYTRNFGGTSGAAPVVSGVAALVLSANPALKAAEVRQILMATADQNLDPTLDLVNDPNVQGLTGEFVNGRSLWFGSGKVNAKRAVERAAALRGPAPRPELMLVPASPGYPSCPVPVPFTLEDSTLAGTLRAADAPHYSSSAVPVATGVPGYSLAAAVDPVPWHGVGAVPGPEEAGLATVPPPTPMAPRGFTGVLRRFGGDGVSTFSDPHNRWTAFLASHPLPGVQPGMWHVHDAYVRTQSWPVGRVINITGTPGQIWDDFGRPQSAIFI